MVEGVEKLLLGPFPAGQVVDVVHEKEVDAPVFFSEFEDLAVLQMVDEVVHEFFGRDVEDLVPRILLESEMAYRVHQVGLAQTGAAVDVERIVRFGRVLRDGGGGH